MPTCSPCPGASGELYLGGPGLARGYQLRPGQTAERFVANPFQPGERLYRTGDRVTMLADGSLQFLGRMDDQVKVRGYRVELREVALALQAVPGVAQAEVVARLDGEGGGDGRMQLHAYAVPQAGVPADRPGWAAALAQALPEYMVPASITVLEGMPLTANGKIDRKALPVPEQAAADLFEAPQGEAEQALAAVWADLFGLERAGRHDDFFALGGDSILALKLVARARKRGVKLTPKQLFTGKTPAGVARLVEGPVAGAEQTEGTAPLPRADRSGPLPLSFAQLRQWFLWQLEPAGTAYHISGALRLLGTLDVLALQQSFDALVARHESLRTVFRMGGDGQVVQVIAAQGSVRVEQTDLSELPAAQRQEQLEQAAAAVHRQPFDLQAGPLLRVGLIRESAEAHLLVVAMHHIVSDGWSMQIIVDEFVQQYRARCQGQVPQAAPCRCSTPTTRSGSASGWRPASGSGNWPTGAPSWATRTPCCNCPPTTRAGPARTMWPPAMACSCRPNWSAACAAAPRRRTQRCSCCCWRACRPCCTATRARKTFAWACPLPTATGWKRRARWAFS